MQDFMNKKILLGICGGIAAYKAAYLVRELTHLGASVRVVMTQSAEAFITPMTLQALSGHEVRSNLFDTQAERAMGHIELARWADYLIIAPASANCLAKLAHGLADDLLSTLYLVANIPVMLCPAMNQGMWGHPAVQKNCDILRERGALIVGPDEGEQACGDYGYGRLTSCERIIHALQLLHVKNQLQNQHVLITAGPTQEAIDPVRYISNRSSGKMGFALAEAAHIAGAEVTLITGPTTIVPPSHVNVIRVTSAQEMLEAVQQFLQPDMIFIGCAAVGDYRLPSPIPEKIKKHKNEDLTLTFVKNPDILGEIARHQQAKYIVGFAAETTELLKHAREKLNTKKLDMIIANSVGAGIGFESEHNEATIITTKEQIKCERMHKITLAGEIIQCIARNI